MSPHAAVQMDFLQPALVLGTRRMKVTARGGGIALSEYNWIVSVDEKVSVAIHRHGAIFHGREIGITDACHGMDELFGRDLPDGVGVFAAMNTFPLASAMTMSATVQSIRIFTLALRPHWYEIPTTGGALPGPAP